MEMMILFIAIAVIRSVIESSKAKAERESRDISPEDGGTKPMVVPTAKVSETDKEKAKPFSLEELFKQFSEDMMKEISGETEVPAPSKPQQPRKKKTPKSKPVTGAQITKQAKQSFIPVTEQKKSTKQPRIPTADAYAAGISVQPVVKQDAYHDNKAMERDFSVTQESIVQGVIWGEILGKPKAYRHR